MCILSRTVPKLLRFIGQIIAFDRGYLSLTQLLGVHPLTYDYETKFGHKKQETSLCRVVFNELRCLEPFT